MRKTLLAVAFAGAALAPATAVTVAATAAATATLVAPSAAVAAPRGKAVQLKKHRRFHRPRLDLRARCVWPRISVRREYVKLRIAGFRHIRYQGRKTFRPRCAQFLYFSACKGPIRYRVIVRYIRFQRYVIAQPLGRCFTLRQPNRRPGMQPRS